MTLQCRPDREQRGGRGVKRGVEREEREERGMAEKMLGVSVLQEEFEKMLKGDDMQKRADESECALRKLRQWLKKQTAEKSFCEYTGCPQQRVFYPITQPGKKLFCVDSLYTFQRLQNN